MTLKISGFLAVVKVHFRATFHRAKCSGPRVIVVTEKQKNSWKQYCHRYRGQ